MHLNPSRTMWATVTTVCLLYISQTLGAKSFVGWTAGAIETLDFDERNIKELSTDSNAASNPSWQTIVNTDDNKFLVSTSEGTQNGQGLIVSYKIGSRGKLYKITKQAGLTGSLHAAVSPKCDFVAAAAYALEVRNRAEITKKVPEREAIYRLMARELELETRDGDTRVESAHDAEAMDVEPGDAPSVDVNPTSESPAALSAATEPPLPADLDGATPLHWAARLGNISLLRRYLRSSRRQRLETAWPRIDGTTDRSQGTPLHWAAIEGQVEAMEILLDAGADAEAVNTWYRTPLHLASRFGHLQAVRLLVEQGANLEARRDTNETPLHFAVEEGRYEVVKYLLDAGADVNPYGDRAPAAQLNPTCIFTPANTLDVSQAVRLFSRNNCQFAIRSGGHSYNPGWAGINNGILISLSELNKITYDRRTKLVTAGSGNRWGDVYDALAPYNVTAVGGRNADIGLGGFLTGGGISYYANEVGWASDNINSVEIVLANGQIVTANRHHNPELFRCIKGGSSNFGIVTKFTLETVDASGPFNMLVVAYPRASEDAMLAAAYDYCTGGSDADPQSQIMFLDGIGGIEDGAGNFLLMVYNGHFWSENPPTVLKLFLDGTVPNVWFNVTLTNGTSREAAYRLKRAQAPGGRYTMGSLSIHADVQLLKDLRKVLIEETTEDIRAVSGFDAALAFQPVGRKWLAASAAKGGNSMGITTPLVLLWVEPSWESAGDDTKMREYMLRVIQRLEENARRHGKLANFRHLNYGNREQDVISHYGPESLAILRRNKLRYDRHNVFGRLVPGGFKIPGF
ncbi:Bifunctional solanapyrone synthase [Drechslerella dactyloides]|uniref:Bifunctional solanapyrone synthase n=1 Tax=Drechslerella dactyloides TaxID=74499 RepID=A0AAD6NI77_DREDA|nr:Bifunctional solanapyrone synthase [Drechslerella dactyloides]